MFTLFRQSIRFQSLFLPLAPGFGFLVCLLLCSGCPAPFEGRAFDATGPATAFQLPVVAVATNEVVNPSLEEGAYDPASNPDGWATAAWQASSDFIWDDVTAFKGTRSVRIDSAAGNDAAWVQTVHVAPNTNYLFSAWVKTENVAHTGGSDPGANLSLWGTWDRSRGVYGTVDWTYVDMVVNSGSTGEMTLAARLGFWGGTTTGTVWFDDLQLTEIAATDPHPRMHLLALVYGSTDFTYMDGGGTSHRVVAAMTEAEKQECADDVIAFALGDLPLLNSGNMRPRIEVRFPSRPLTQLSPIGQKWWPSPSDTSADLDPKFDSVLVIWDPRGTDLTTGQPVNLNGAAGLTPNRGRSQMYTALIAQTAVTYNQRNAFKHEWGHCILGYFEAMGASPLPTVTNHATPGQYVHWPNREDYVWVDETHSNPIPKSIYHNWTGFTHDYYSGTTATPDEPERRLGITPDAWAVGGPISTPLRKLQTPAEWIETLRSLVEDQVSWNELDLWNGLWLVRALDTANRFLEHGRTEEAAERLEAVAHRVDFLLARGTMEPENADVLLFGIASIVW